MGFETRKKGKYTGAEKFIEKMKEIQEEAKTVLGKVQADCKEAKLQAGIKPTALCSAIDKENSIESPLDFTTLYIQLLSWLCTLSPIVLMPVS